MDERVARRRAAKAACERILSGVREVRAAERLAALVATGYDEPPDAYGDGGAVTALEDRVAGLLGTPAAGAPGYTWTGPGCGRARRTSATGWPRPPGSPTACTSRSTGRSAASPARHWPDRPRSWRRRAPGGTGTAATCTSSGPRRWRRS